MIFNWCLNVFRNIDHFNSSPTMTEIWSWVLVLGPGPGPGNRMAQNWAGWNPEGRGSFPHRTPGVGGRSHPHPHPHPHLPPPPTHPHPPTPLPLGCLLGIAASHTRGNWLGNNFKVPDRKLYHFAGDCGRTVAVACLLCSSFFVAAFTKLVNCASANMGDHADYLFKAEYAKSSRASCKSCKGLITKDSLRLAVMVQVTIYHMVNDCRGQSGQPKRNQCLFKHSHLRPSIYRQYIGAFGVTSHRQAWVAWPIKCRGYLVRTYPRPNAPWPKRTWLGQNVPGCTSKRTRPNIAYRIACLFIAKSSWILS